MDFPHVRAGFGGSTGGRAGPRPLLVGFGLAFLAVILLRTAWVSDAAYLTLRTVEHAASGFGVRWNVDERVQTYDHPLWLLLLLAGRLVTGETYFTTLGLSVAASIGCAWIVMREAGTDAGAVLALAALGLSPLFVSFSTSGLESPLLHLLTAGIVICAAAAAAVSAPRRRVAFAALVGLAALTRWTIWLAAGPAFIALLVRASRETRVVMAALALVPLGSWLLWAWWYYGTWGSNAWLADHTAAAWSVRAAAGWSFLQGTARLDLLLVEIAAVGVLVGLAAGGMRALLALGALLQGAWVVAAGGSPMAGRDLTVPYLIGLILIVWELRARRPATVTLATVAVIAVAAAAPHSTIAADASYGTGFQPTARTHDARAEYYQATGLLLENRFRRAPVHPEAVRARQLAQSGAAVAISATPGIFGAAAGPTIHVIDPRGRTDPLLARLPPAVGVPTVWGAPRRIPDGYLASTSGSPAINGDPSLAALETDIGVVTRAPLIARGRLAQIWRLPADVRMLVARSSYGPQGLTASDVGPAAAVRTIGEGGAIVRLDARRPVSTLTARLSVRYDYEIQLLDGASAVGTVTSPRLTWRPAPDAVRRIPFGRPRAATAVWFRCGRGSGACTLAQVDVGH